MSNRMENKCNKRLHHSKIFNTKCLEQLYCHTNPNRLYSNKLSINSNGSGSSTIPCGDLLTLIKENKQLKTMLIFHLDLIQEQNEQIIAKDKLLLKQSEELQRFNNQNNVLQKQLQDLQKQLQRQIKRVGDVSTVPPPPLAKIQCNFNNLTNRSSTGQQESSANEPNTKDANNCNNSSSSQKPPHIIGECNGKLISKIILQKISLPVKSEEYMQSPQTTTDTEYTEEDYDEIEQMHDAPSNENEYENENALNYGNCDAKNYSNNNNNNSNNNSSHLNNNSSADVYNENDKNPNLFQYNNTIEEEEDIGISAITSNEDNSQLIEIKSNILQNKQKFADNLKKDISAIATVTTDTDTGTTVKHLNTPQIYKIVANNSNTVSDNKSSLLKNNYDKEITMMDWKTSSGHHIDESGSCDSTNEIDKQQVQVQTTVVKNANATSTKSILDNNDNKRSVSSKAFNNTMVQQQKSKRSFLLTNQLYYTREWEDEYFAVQNDCEFIKGEAKALDSDIPMLEIPKWTEHELSPLYSIEGTEDLSDETFIKRHTKLEIDEKRRKKWDVQQIREQRRIEKLKRRHCKDELTSSQDQQLIHSFYPPTDAVQSIYYVENLPVQAFGEMIPCLNGNHDQQNFSLPWLDKDYKTQQTCSSSSYRPSVVTMEISQTENSSSQQSQQQMLNSSFVFVKKRKRHQSSAATVSCTSASSSRQRHSEKQKTTTAMQNLANLNQNQISRRNSLYVEAPHCSNASQYVTNNIRN